jgi:hypothetical protein
MEHPMANTKAKKQGQFVASLKRNNDQIKSYRADSISSKTELAYKHKVENLDFLLDDLRRKQDEMLDMSPDNTQSLVLAKNFDEKVWVEEDNRLALEIHNTEVKLKLAKARFKTLFG